MTIQYKDLKKNDQIKTNQLLGPVNKEMPTGKLLESPKQGRGLKKTILIYSNGKEIGMLNEAGSVYASEIIEVKRDGVWHQVTGQPQINGVKDLHIRNFVAVQ
jgi:aconitase B